MRSDINYNPISHLHSSRDWVISQHRHVLINASADARMSLSTQHVTVSWSCYCLSFHSHAGLMCCCFQNTGWILKFVFKMFFLHLVFVVFFQSFWIKCLRLMEFYAHCFSIRLSVECLLCYLLLLTCLISLMSFVSPQPSACVRLFWISCACSHILTSPFYSWGETSSCCFQKRLFELQIGDRETDGITCVHTVCLDSVRRPSW